MVGAAASGDTNMGPTNVNMGPAATEVTTGEVGAAKTSKMASAKMTSTSVTTTSMAASAPGKGHRWHCDSTQKSSHHGHDHCFSQHRSLRHLV
jgi:hypothetical protein